MAANELVIEPNKLKFNGITRTAVIRLHNPTAQENAFKMKTIEPGYYRVKPSKGIIGPEQSATVTVQMRPLEKCKVHHFITSKQKFLVQWVACENTVGKTVVELLSNTQVHEVKLDCEFDAQHSQSQEKSDSYKSVIKSVGTPELRDQSDETDSSTITPAEDLPSSQWLSRPRLVVALLSALVLFCGIFLTYYKLAHTNSGANN